MFLSLFLLSLSSSFYTSEIYTVSSNKIFIVFCILRLHHLEHVSRGGEKSMIPIKLSKAEHALEKQTRGTYLPWEENLL